MPRQQRNSRDEGSFSKPAEPLARAFQVQREAASLNFDWPDAHGALRKLLEEIEELEALLPPNATSAAQESVSQAVEEEIGDLLFAAVNVARLCDVRPGPALSRATGKFERRFAQLLSRADQLGIDTRRVSLEELDRLWESVKREERDRT